MSIAGRKDGGRVWNNEKGGRPDLVSSYEISDSTSLIQSTSRIFKKFKMAKLGVWLSLHKTNRPDTERQNIVLDLCFGVGIVGCVSVGHVRCCIPDL